MQALSVPRGVFINGRRALGQGVEAYMPETYGPTLTITRTFRLSTDKSSCTSSFSLAAHGAKVRASAGLLVI